MLALIKDLIINFEDIKANGIGILTQLNKIVTLEQEEAVLQKTHDILVLESDKQVVYDAEYPIHLCRQLQLTAGLHIASLSTDTAAGTGSVSNETIDSFSRSNTMAKNNAEADDWWNMTHFGTNHLTIRKFSNFRSHWMST
jgi:hypothetical protein